MLSNYFPDRGRPRHHDERVARPVGPNADPAGADCQVPPRNFRSLQVRVDSPKMVSFVLYRNNVDEVAL